MKILDAKLLQTNPSWKLEEGFQLLGGWSSGTLFPKVIFYKEANEAQNIKPSIQDHI